MSPAAVLKTLWNHKLIAFPVLVLTLIAGVYVFQFAPRSYESTMTYALINPSIPSQEQILANPSLSKLNGNNPYLRSSDPSLIVQVVITQLSDASMAQKLAANGLSDKYTVTRGIAGQSSFLIDITGTGSTPETSTATTRALGKALEEDLRTIQKINGAADEYIYTSLVVVSPDQATEQFSSRLRSLIVVLLGGVVLMFGAVSAARGIDSARERKRNSNPKLAENVRDYGSVGTASSAVEQFEPIDITTALHGGSRKTKSEASEDTQRKFQRTTASGDVAN